MVDDSPADGLLLAHTTLLALAALPGRDLHFQTGFGVVVASVHSVIAPLGLLAILVVTFMRGRAAAAKPPYLTASDLGGGSTAPATAMADSV
jgi:hypothetical protein